MLFTKKPKTLADLANISVSNNYLKMFSSRLVFFLRLVCKNQLNDARLTCFYLLGMWGFFSLKVIQRGISPLLKSIFKKALHKFIFHLSIVLFCKKEGK